ncbi:unnamed protein product [Protopolystoma xenopodis]|uniref:Uncharacterized protein n=1 Tax=Protopolystoma xenopodis TaxID=117903 RepID=A0A448XQ39_9PLAT|nr:unnamed protein product [Protopolystoma xenopodis]
MVDDDFALDWHVSKSRDENKALMVTPSHENVLTQASHCRLGEYVEIYCRLKSGIRKNWRPGHLIQPPPGKME